MNNKSQANISSIKLDSFYVLTKGTNGVLAKFIGALLVVLIDKYLPPTFY
jgi:hypothetical protein